MTLFNRMIKSGNKLFRWRSFFPLLFLPILLLTASKVSITFKNYHTENLWELICFSLSLIGLFLRILTVGFAPKNTSGRSTTKFKADVLNRTGIYSFTRNPLYFANFLICLGIILLFHNILLGLVYVLAFWLYYERIILAEEEFLKEKFGAEFEEWAKSTPAFFPKFRAWIKPSTPFSIKKVFKKEKSTFLALVLSFTSLDLIKDFYQFHKIKFESIWIFLTVFSIITFLIIYFLERFLPPLLFISKK